MQAITKSLALFALTLGIGTTLPNIADAHHTPSHKATISQNGVSKLDQLGLTSTQKDQVKKLAQQRSRAIGNLLTKEQKAQLQQSFKNGKTPAQAFQSVSFSGQQKQKIASTLEEYDQKFKDILTPEQLTKFNALFNQ
jgi:Spy/CpxP family protein refolding chaperone